ncbi:MAG: c-type cytochrome domain-containing protein, partial [Planctomycetota bacterium]
MTLFPHTLFAFLFLLAPVAAQGGEKPADKPVEEKPAQEPETKPDAGKPAKPENGKADDKTKKGDKKDKVDFAAQIQPILEKNCVECHKAPYTDDDGKKRRPKGGVILDSKDGMTKSKKGKLLVAKKPDDSKLVHSITLPADDEDRMPPAKKGDPLSQDDIDLIKKWIEEGTDFGTWTGTEQKADDKSGDGKDEKGEKSDEKSGDKGAKDKGTGEKGKKKSEALADGLAPLPEATIAAVTDAFTVEAIEVASPLLRVTCYGREGRIDDAALTALQPIASHVHELVLARTQITDAGMATIASMPRLSHFDLRATKIGDAGCKELAALSHLTSLNLYGTKVGDAGIAALSRCTSLENVYVWQTPASADAVVALQHAVPL